MDEDRDAIDRGHKRPSPKQLMRRTLTSAVEGAVGVSSARVEQFVNRTPAGMARMPPTRSW